MYVTVLKIQVKNKYFGTPEIAPKRDEIIAVIRTLNCLLIKQLRNQLK